ncbi:hypothetical protein L0657_11420 [Dyadobacter sp. CY345]|uniref:hypothetical protein n=1 Tax=Dyadobacter sp. CY345 TaxID=2909335 RepID=UPI001F2BD9D7|nr:hypothetical protein [Dyadobacter sp. CY345]MCF2444567.1 hypothetical protein [Dyadobacter sp. CY345]
MKNFRIIKSGILLIALFVANVSQAFAFDEQLKITSPPKGYWTVETNTKKPGGSIIRFYTEDSKLVYEEHLRKISLDVDRPKTVVLLNAALDEAMINFGISGTAIKNGNLVAELKRRGVDEQLYTGRKN